MADQDSNANYGSTNKSSSSSGSPWDEDLDILVDEPQKPTAIVGSLEPETLAVKEKTPVPFNVPEDIIEDKVGKKIPADQIMGKDIPQFYDSDKEPKLKVDKNNIQNSNDARLTINNVEPQKQQPLQEPVTKDNNNFGVTSEKNSQNNKNNSTTPSVVKETGISELIKNNEPVKDNNTVLKAQNNLDDVFEDPFESPLSPPVITAGKQTNDANIVPAQPVEDTKDPNLDTKTELPNGNQVLNIQDKTVLEPVVPISSTNKGIDSLSKASTAKPSLKQPIETQKDKETSTAIQNAVEPAVPTKSSTPPKKGFSFFKKKTNGTQESKNNEVTKQEKISQPTKQNNNIALSAQKQSQRPKRQPFHLPPSISIVVSILLICVAITYLTEIGLVSIGFENVYGAFGVEKLWGGLPRSAESALGMTVSNQKNHLLFKYSGKLTVTVDKTKKSPVTLPLVSYSHDIIPKIDFGMSLSEKAQLSQSNGYEDYYGSDSSSSDNLSSTDSSSSSSSSIVNDSEDVEEYDEDINQTDTDIEDSLYESTSNSDYSSVQTTIKQLDFEVSGTSNEKSIASSIILKPLVGNNKEIELMNANGELYVKSDDIEFNDKAEKDKWLDYKLGKLGQENNNIVDLFNISTDSGLSIMGRRTGNEKVGDTRCFKYKIDSFEIGDSLDNIGIPQEAINSITGTVWIGVKDHLIHQVNITIVPSISAGFTNIQADIMFFDYDIDNNIEIPLLSNIVKVTSDSSSNISDHNTNTNPDITTLPVVEVPPNDTGTNNSRIANDSKRDQDLNSIKVALVKYKNVFGKYPVSYGFENINISSSVLKKSLISNYISSIPSDPKSDEGWWYGYKSDGKTFTLSARFENINDTEVTKVGSVYLHYVKN